MKQKTVIFLGLLLFLILVIFCVFVHAPKIETKIADHTKRLINESGAAAIAAEVSGRRVTLSGVMDSSVAISEIMHQVDQSDGVRAVKNNLTYFQSPQDSSENEKVKILPVREIRPAEALSKMQIRFANNSKVPEDGALLVVDQVTDFMRADSNLKLIIAGHTDNRGSDSFNKDLSLKRAKAIKALLVSAGIDESRIDAVGFGEEQPASENTTEYGMQRNRRVDFRVKED